MKTEIDLNSHKLYIVYRIPKFREKTKFQILHRHQLRKKNEIALFNV